MRIKFGPDELVWIPTEYGKYAPKLGYISLLSDRKLEITKEWWRKIWTLKTPLWSRLFMWSVLSNKTLTGDSLLHISIYGSNWCVFCKRDSKSNEHLFLLRPVVVQLWQAITQQLSIKNTWQEPSILQAWNTWTAVYQGSKRLCLPLILCWTIWLTWNHIIFNEATTRWPLIIAKVVAAYHDIPEVENSHIRRTNSPSRTDKTRPWAFFDGVAQIHGCGGGFILHISEQHFYKVQMVLGEGTNNYVELITLRHLLHFSLAHDFTTIQILGD